MPTAPSTVPFLTDSQIETRASELLKNQGIASAPIDPVLIAKRLSIEVFKADFSDGTCGVIEMPSSGPARIYFNGEHPVTRQRFTVAHEIGHFLLHKGQEKFVDTEINLFRVSDQGATELPKARMEIQSNKFAAALLMPADLVAEARKVTKDVSRLADLFGVSREAMGIRLANLDMATFG